MGEEFFTEFNNSQKPGGLASLASKYRPDILFFNPEDASPWVGQLRNMPDWRPVYLDESAVIYLRKGYATQIGDLDHGRILAGRDVSPEILKDVQTILYLCPPTFGTFLEGFYRHRH